MLFRRSASLVNAVQIDGTEAALRAALALSRLPPAMRDEGVEVSTSFGRRIARRGSWLTRDMSTSAVRLYEDAAFQASHEAVR